MHASIAYSLKQMRPFVGKAWDSMARNSSTVTLPAAPIGPVSVSGAGVALFGETGDQVAVVAKFFRALGDPTRLRLLEFLLAAEHTVSECVAHVGLSQGRVSAHLGCLADCGYVASRREGRFCHYRVSDPRVADLIMAARSLAADNATALSACRRIQP